MSTHKRREAEKVSYLQRTARLKMATSHGDEKKNAMTSQTEARTTGLPKHTDDVELQPRLIERRHLGFDSTGMTELPSQQDGPNFLLWGSSQKIENPPRSSAEHARKKEKRKREGFFLLQ